MSLSQSDSSNKTRLSLVARAAQREAAAWEELVELYGPLVASWCRRLGLDVHSAADCVQEVFASVVAKLADFRHPSTAGALRAWLWTIAKNKIRDHFRRRRSEPLAAGGDGVFSRLEAIPDDDPTDDVQMSQLIRRALAQVEAEFEPRTWQAFWRTAVDGVPTGVVAAELGINPAAVRQAKSRVLRRLRAQLGDV